MERYQLLWDQIEDFKSKMKKGILQRVSKNWEETKMGEFC